jgi:hypothetical protein
VCAAPGGRACAAPGGRACERVGFRLSAAAAAWCAAVPPGARRARAVCACCSKKALLHVDHFVVPARPAQHGPLRIGNGSQCYQIFLKMLSRMNWVNYTEYSIVQSEQNIGPQQCLAYYIAD